MTDKTITLDRELVSRIVGLRPDYTCAQLDADEELVRAALADPVPPAGGKPDPIIAVLKGHLADGMNPMFSGGDLKHLIGRLEAGTRLQAEVERLGSIGRGQRKTIDNVQLQVERLQAELTKARQLLADVAKTPWMYDVLGSVREYVANQSAPADKGQGEPVAWVVFDNGFIDDHTVVKTVADEWADCGIEVTPLYAEQPAPTTSYTAVGMSTAAAQGFRDGQAAPVVMPERMEIPSEHQPAYVYRKGWNACLDEFARLNSEPKP